MMSIKRRRLPVELLFLLFLITLFHWRGIRPGYTFLPVDLANNNLPWLVGERQPLQNSLVSDPLYQFFPFLTTSVRDSQDYQWSLWNPDIFTGHPSLGDPLSQPFFPVQLLAGLILGAAKGFAIGLWLQALLAGGLTYGWLRSLDATRVASVAGGLVYALSGYLVTWFETPFWVGTLCLFPGVLWTLELAYQRKNFRFAALSGALYGLSILSGQLQFMIIITVFMGLYTIGRSFELSQKHKYRYWWPFLALAIAIIIGVLLGSIFLLPANELLEVSRRSTPIALSDGLPFSQLITLIMPNFFGSPTNGGAYWGLGNYSEGTIYAGIIALLMACIAPFIDKRFFTRYTALIAIGILYFVVGGPGVRLLRFIPGIQYASLHRTNFIIPLLVAFLLAMALSNLNLGAIRFLGIGIISLLTISGIAYWLNVGLAQEHQDYLRKEFFIAAGLLILSLIVVYLSTTYPRYQSALLWGFVFLVFTDLYWFGNHFNPVGRIDQLMPLTPGIRFLQNQDVSHAAAIAPQRMVALQQQDQVLFGPNVPTVFGLNEAGGYSSLVNRRYHQLIRAGDPDLDVWWMDRNGNMVTFSNPSERLLDILQVSHVVASVPYPLSLFQAEFVNDECGDETETLSKERPLSDQFTVQNTAINRIEFLFANSGAEDTYVTESVNIRLWQDAIEEQLVFETQEEITNLNANNLKTYFFEPETSAPGQTYIWEITTDADETNLSLCLNELGESAVSVYGNVWTETYVDEFVVYKTEVPIPRAYVVYAVEQISDDKNTVARLMDNTFPIRHAAISAENTSLPNTGSLPSTPASILEYEDTRILLNANAEQDGLLVLGDQYYPGWRASVDGELVPILRVNHIYRGILLSAGEHEVEFLYRPISLYVGAGLSFIGILLLCLLMIFNHRLQKISENKQ